MALVLPDWMYEKFTAKQIEEIRMNYEMGDYVQQSIFRSRLYYSDALYREKNNLPPSTLPAD